MMVMVVITLISLIMVRSHDDFLCFLLTSGDFDDSDDL